MLIRCPQCNKLYPEHLKECGYCTGKPKAAAPEKSPLLSRPPASSRPSAPRPAPPPTPSQPAPTPAVQSEFTSVSNTAESFSQGKGGWNAEQGGSCPACGTYNPGHHTFCGECRSMLARSTEAALVQTSYPLKDMKGLLVTFVQKLNAQNIKTTQDLLGVACTKRNRDSLVRQTGLSERSLLRLVHAANLCRIPAVDTEKALMLELAGITSLPDLLALDAQTVYDKLQRSKNAINAQNILVLPTKSQVAQWLEQARALPPLAIQ